MAAMCITRHHTLPASLPTQSSSKDQIGEDIALNEAPLPNTEEAQRRTTQLRTVSSVTSFLTGSPTVRSPLIPENQAPMFHFSPPVTPSAQQTQFQMPNASVNPAMCSTNYNIFSDFPSNRDMGHDFMPAHGPAAQLSSMHVPYSPYSQLQPNHIHQSQMTFLSPFCASGNYIPAPSPNTVVSRNNASPNNSNLSYSTAGSVHGPPQQNANLQASPIVQIGSPLSFYTDATHDSMLQEITRLRERLATVESENASMASKLKQQQWEIENRLSELEMQMCTSDMGSTESTDDRMNPFENMSRESII